MLDFYSWVPLDTIPWLEFAFGRDIKSEAASLRLGPWMAVLPLSLALCVLLIWVRTITGRDNQTAAQATSGPDK